MRTRISESLLALLIFSISLPVFAAGELVVNGTFTEGNSTSPPALGTNQPPGWTGFSSNDSQWDGVTSTPGFYAGNPTASPDSGGQNYGDASDLGSNVRATLSQTIPEGYSADARDLNLSFNVYAGTTNGNVTVTLVQGGTSFTTGAVQGTFPGGAPAWTPFSWDVNEETEFNCREPIELIVEINHNNYSPNPFGNIHGYWVDDISLFDESTCSATAPTTPVPTLPQWTLILLLMLTGLLGFYGVRRTQS